MGPRDSNFGTVAGLHETVTWKVHETVTWKGRWRVWHAVASQQCRRVTLTDVGDPQRWRETQRRDADLAPVMSWLERGERPGREELSPESLSTKCLESHWVSDSDTLSDMAHGALPPRNSGPTRRPPAWWRDFNHSDSDSDT
ncbi:hypothetical protein E2C01_070071 [Portunus trituberculatus]|uniref:Uncharacterized protein n=1 Tax=Portunus trituberculatus TaxID=210409 RepID=A0A5B7I464_PORTR|nr:hypothetical protein [Portunus trituberculatus]